MTTNTLHILNKSPGHPRFYVCLAALKEGDVLVLTENGALALADQDIRLPDHSLALEADLEARGLMTTANPEQVISYDEFVQLTADNSRIVCW